MWMLWRKSTTSMVSQIWQNACQWASLVCKVHVLVRYVLTGASVAISMALSSISSENENGAIYEYQSLNSHKQKHRNSIWADFNFKYFNCFLFVIINKRKIKWACNLRKVLFLSKILMHFKNFDAFQKFQLEQINVRCKCNWKHDIWFVKNKKNSRIIRMPNNLIVQRYTY